MGRKQLSGLPDKDLISLIQQDPTNHLPFDILYARWSGKLKKHSSLRNMHPDDVEDVLSNVWMKVWLNLPTFEHRLYGAFERWLRTIVSNASKDHWRKQKRLQERLPSVSLDREIRLKDGNTVSLGETIPSDLEEDLTDRKQKELVLEGADNLVERGQLNEKQRELVRCRIIGEPLPPEWSESWIHTNWYRSRSKVETETKEIVANEKIKSC